MKFFKHFTDAHRGQSLQLLRRKFGMAGLGRYWTLVELCAEKMTKSADEEYQETHCVFNFAKPYLTLSLGYANAKQTSSYLQALAELGLCSAREDGEVFSCSMPKLLVSLDRDAKRARIVRAVAAPKKKRKSKKKNNTTELVKVTTPEELVEQVGDENIKALLEIYPQGLLDQEFPRMAFWLRNHTPKSSDYVTFVSGWLANNVDRYLEANRAQEQKQKVMGLMA